jgi:geranylgeranyl diphosphate synthase type II
MDTNLDLKSLVNEHIASLSLSSRKPANLYEPMDYLLSLGGKRIRPVLTMLAYQAVSGKAPTDAINLATALELFHNFSLMHDDIMDRAPFRRGKPSVHAKWNDDVAILSGDALFALSIEMIAQEFPEKAAPLSIGYSRVSMEVCEGQMEDMDMAEMDDADIPMYIEMIRKKTAALLGGCLRLGAIAGGASSDIQEKFKDFGESLGIGFQLQDDLMDAFPPAGFGKQEGGDIIENKKTFLLIKTLELAKGDQAKELEALLSLAKDEDNPRKVAGVLEIMKSLSIPEITQNLIDEYFQRAEDLGKELAKETQFDALKAYLEVIAKRKF